MMKNKFLPHIVISISGVLLHGAVSAAGAIAVDSSNSTTAPAYGYAIDEPTRDAAERAALDACRHRGSQCELKVRFDTCGAYASSRYYYGYGWGGDKATAAANALKMCGRDSCEVIVAKCDRGGNGY